MKCIPNYELLPHNKKNDRYRQCGRALWSGGLDDLQLCRRSYTLQVHTSLTRSSLSLLTYSYISSERQSQKETLMLFLHTAF